MKFSDLRSAVLNVNGLTRNHCLANLFADWFFNNTTITVWVPLLRVASSKM